MAKTEGKLVICPTPLGNLGDITKRSLNALKECSVICCEDTRVTGKLLSALGIEKRLERLDEATISRQALRVIKRVLDGEYVVYCSDAGMPGVSDPGQRLIDCAYKEGARVEVLPGGTAVATAYVASGFTAQSFYFGSFFPRKTGERVRLLGSLSKLDAVLVFYESPQRIVSSLKDLSDILPLRSVAVCRELTKVHEEVVRGNIKEVYEIFSSREKAGSIKGEIVLVIDSPNKEEKRFSEETKAQNAHQLMETLLDEGVLSKKEIVSRLRKEFNMSRNAAYDLVYSGSSSKEES